MPANYSINGENGDNLTGFLPGVPAIETGHRRIGK
jgi:hypothetical protein